MTRYNWQKPKKTDYVKFRSASPNLLQLKEHLIKMYGGTNVGIYNRRPVRGGDAPSSHSFGAALDWRYTNRKDAVSAINFIVKNHKKLGVQMVVDYVGLRTWTVDGGWKTQKPNAHGMGQAWAKWIHVETTKESWRLNTPVDAR